MRQIEVKGIPIWIFPHDLNKAGEKLIDDHIDQCGSLIQLNTYRETEQYTIRGIDALRDMNFTIMFIHIYPGKIKTISYYLKEDITNDLLKISLNLKGVFPDSTIELKKGRNTNE